MEYQKQCGFLTC